MRTEAFSTGEKCQSQEKVSTIHDGDEAIVWQNFKSGKQAAFVYIYNTYFQMLMNIGCQLTRDKSLVKDCIQDLFIELISRRSNLGDVNSIKLYLIKCFRRKMIKYIEFSRKKLVREKNAGQNYSIEISQEEKLINSQQLEQQKEKIARGINLLSEKEREAIYYFYYQNLSYKEIKEIFNYTQVKTVRTLVYQALKKLRIFL